MTQQNSLVSKPLGRVAAIWLCTAIVGQLAFFAYIAMFYAFTALTGDIAEWNSNPLLNVPPFDPQDPANTWAFGMHAIGAGYIALMGGIQLLTPVRRRYPKFHRINGRVFLATVVTLTASGFYLVWVRGPSPGSLGELSLSLNGLLILVFAFFALRCALARDFQQHQRWAIRLYLVSNAQWFLRIGGFGYFLSMQALGVTVEFDGLFFKFWAWGCFLVPLAICEMYFRARVVNHTIFSRITAGSLIGSTAAMLVGSLAFSLFIFQLTLGSTA